MWSGSSAVPVFVEDKEVLASPPRSRMLGVRRVSLLPCRRHLRRDQDRMGTLHHHRLSLLKLGSNSGKRAIRQLDLGNPNHRTTKLIWFVCITALPQANRHRPSMGSHPNSPVDLPPTRAIIEHVTHSLNPGADTHTLSSMRSHHSHSSSRGQQFQISKVPLTPSPLCIDQPAFIS